MAIFMQMEGIPGHPGWDGWFEVRSFQFGAQRNHSDDGVSLCPASCLQVSRRVDAMSSSIIRRNASGDDGDASLWLSDKNGIPLWQVDMKHAIVATYSIVPSSRDEQFSLSFTEMAWSRATDP